MQIKNGVYCYNNFIFKFFNVFFYLICFIMKMFTVWDQDVHVISIIYCSALS